MRRIANRPFTLFAAIAALFFACSAGFAAEPPTAIVHLSKFTENLHAPFMALKLATAMAKEGATVTLFLDLEAVRLADENAPLDLMWGKGHDSLSKLYVGFVAAGGRVVLCPHCAEAAGVTTVRKDARIATQDELGKLFLGADKIVDY
jgi:sulfur relay (sulfurtransferase) complex TusBCD TusD component (DsrE family)